MPEPRPLFLRPDHLHAASRVLSATSESGLTVSPPEPATANKGTLRLRATGTPGAVSAITALCQTGGNPVGYATADFGGGAGTGMIWRNTADAVTLYRGYNDSIYLTKVEFPTTYANFERRASTPRTLPDGNLGFLVTSTTSALFHNLTPSGTLVTAQADAVFGTFNRVPSGSILRSDFVILPSGRLVAFIVCQNLGVANLFFVKSAYSDDDGATWSILSKHVIACGAQVYDVSAEYVDDMIVLLLGREGAGSTRVYVSRDGGCTATLVQDDVVLLDAPRMALTTTGTLLVTSRATNAVTVHTIAPGGGLSAATATGIISNFGFEHAIVTRDDGTIWIYAAEVGVANAVNMQCAVSTDGGATWTNAAGSQDIADFEFVAASPLIYCVSAGVWQDHIILLMSTETAGGGGAGSSHNVQLWHMGGWDTLTERRNLIASNGQPYESVYTPVEYPQNVGWTKTDVAAGATVGNQGSLNIVSTAVNNSWWYSTAVFFANAAGDTRRVRFRTKMNSGGSTTDKRAFIAFIMSDTVNEQEVYIQLATTGATIYDGAGNLLSTITDTLTEQTNWIVALRHDLPSAGAGEVSVYYKLDSDTAWTTAVDGAAVAEVVGTRERVEFGGKVAGAADWSVSFIGAARDDNELGAGAPTNPDDLLGRPLTTLADYGLASMIKIGGRNGFAIPGDTYSVTSTYDYGKESVWRELRPSRHVRSSADGGAWDWRGDASGSDLFKGDFVALFGTNFRTCSFQLHTADSWAGPDVSITLDATLVTSTVGAANRGIGYFGPAASPNWRPGQYKSDANGRRFFAQAGSTVYEITDNDADRLHIKGFNFGASGLNISGTFYIFGDRMAAPVPWSALRYMRVLVSSLDTADGYYRLGTVVFNSAFTPGRRYDHGFVDKLAPNVDVTETEGGYRIAARLGPNRNTLQVKWANINRLREGDVELRIRDYFAALDGSRIPVVFWRDPNDLTTLGLYRIVGTYTNTNVWGEGSTAVSGIDGLILEEEL